MKNLFILAGCPGSGKSTWAHKHLGAENAAIISRDWIRMNLLKPNEEYFAHEAEVFQQYIEAIQLELNNPETKLIYADATHLNQSSRLKLLNKLVIPTDVDVNLIMFKVPLETCLERNAKRTGRAFVPESQVRRMYHQFSAPGPVEATRYTNIMEVIE